MITILIIFPNGTRHYTSKTLSAGTSLTDYQNSHYQFKTSLTHPKFALYLGRRACPAI